MNMDTGYISAANIIVIIMFMYNWEARDEHRCIRVPGSPLVHQHIAHTYHNSMQRTQI